MKAYFRQVCIMFLAIGVFVMAMAGNSVAGEPLTLATLDWEPYIGESLEGNGFVGEIVREACKRGGYDVTYKFFPWARVVHLSKAGQVDGYFPEYYAEDVKENAIFSEPFPGGPIGFFKRKGEAISYKTLEDLKGIPIGVVRGYVNTAAFDAATFLTKDEAVDDLTNLRKLLHKRIDLAVMDKYVGLSLIQHHLPNAPLEFADPPLAVNDLFLCISKKTALPEEKIAAINSGLKAMKADGTLDAIMKKYGF